MRVSIGPRPYRSLGNYRRVSGFGALPGAESLVSGDVRGDGVNGLGPGNPAVPDFANRYKRAKELSEIAESEFQPGTPVRTLEKSLYTKLTNALQLVNTNYLWDTGLFGRSAEQAARLKAALYETNQVLSQYSALELAISKVPMISPQRIGYDPEMDPAVIAARESAAAAKADQDARAAQAAAAATAAATERAIGVEASKRGITTTEYKSMISEGPKFWQNEFGETSWAKVLGLGAAGLAVLGVAAGVLLKKPPRAVAGYRRRRRR